MQEIYYPSSDGKTVIHAYIWAAEKPVAILQIVHGMAEHSLRYTEFATYLSKNGITVCAEDHLGHGKSVTDKSNYGYFADEKGYKPVLNDIRALAVRMKEENPGLPYFMFGHSMGSFFTRKYLSLYGGELSGAVIAGTGYLPSIVTATGKLLARLVALFRGWHHRSKLLDKCAFGSYNKRFEGRTPSDWLSTDEASVDKFLSDENCNFKFTCNGFFGLFGIIGATCNKRAIKSIPDGLPLFVASGGDDPVGDYGKGVIKFEGLLEKYGKNDSAMLYNGCRHEIINDVCAPQVYEDVLEFINDNSQKC